MEVKYRSSDWEKTKSEIRNLIGLGSYGKGVIDELKDITDNLEKVNDRISKYDSDGSISFSYSSDKDKYQRLFEDFKVLEEYSDKVGNIVEDTIDHPFHEDMDAFVHKMRDASISNFTTDNRIGAVQVQNLPQGQGTYSEVELEKKEVSIEDLFTGDTFYANELKSQYELWIAENPNEEITFEDFQLASANTRAFEYESIEDGQMSLEFWVNVSALVVTVGVAVICPPAGLTLAAAYGSLELGSAISGKDWASGRELGTTERWLRGGLAPLDIIPGVAGVKRFASTARTAGSAADISRLAANPAIGSTIRTQLSNQSTSVKSLVQTARQSTVSRVTSARQVINDKLALARNNVNGAIQQAAEKVDNVATNLRAGMEPNAALARGGRLDPEPVTYFSNKVKDAGIVKSSVSDVGKGTGENIIQGARYGERKISDETYGKLRRASPSSKIQREVNKNSDDIIGTEDFALPGKIIDKKLHADHIVSLEKIARMEGFETLTYNQQKEIANFVENFIGLSEVANTSKGSKSFADWYIYKKENIPVNPVFRDKMIVKEKELEIEIQKMIDEFNRINKKE